MIIRILFTGYGYLQNIDYTTCLELCRQDEKCTAVVHGELLPPLTSSVCKFFNTENSTLTLIHATSSVPPTRTHLVILESSGNGNFLDATLEGKPFHKYNTTSYSCQLTCDTTRIFCDAHSFEEITPETGTCSLYSLKDITGIAFSDNSSVKL